MDTFSSAIEKDPNFADAYNNRSIAKRIAGQDAEQDEDWADALTLHDKQWHETLMQQRKWMCVGYNARGEPEGRSDATDADFLISFASPDRVENNRILAELQKGVFFEGQVREVTFCTDKSLGMGVHIAEDQVKRWNPIFSDLDQPRLPGEYPAWFKHYKKAAKESKHGILILQLTEAYLKSKACRWEFGYVRAPDLVHVYIAGSGPSPGHGRIVKWQELMDNDEYCRQCFGEDFGSLLPDSDAFEADKDALRQMDRLAFTAKLAEHQAWCELPLRQLAYAFARHQFGWHRQDAMLRAGILATVYFETGLVEKAYEMAETLVHDLQRDYPIVHAALVALGAFPNPEQLVVRLETAIRSERDVFHRGHAYVPDLLVPKMLLDLVVSADKEDYSQQKEVLWHALGILKQLYGIEKRADEAVMLMHLASACRSLRMYNTQKALLERVLQDAEKQHGSEDPKVASILLNLSIAHRDLGNYDKQKELLERALPIGKNAHGQDHEQVAVTLIHLGDAYGNLGQDREATKKLKEALKIKQKLYGEEHPEVVVALMSLGKLHGRLAEYEQQKGFLEHALRINEQHYGEDHAELVPLLTDLSNACGMLQKELLERAQKIQKHSSKELSNFDKLYATLGILNRQEPTTPPEPRPLSGMLPGCSWIVFDCCRTGKVSSFATGRQWCCMVHPVSRERTAGGQLVNFAEFLSFQQDLCAIS
ncbi:unnamed protein product [Symbiodinium sp. KB8]|nr:unnamed protein product [Symbiodinium sp. KB8]